MQAQKLILYLLFLLGLSVPAYVSAQVVSYSGTNFINQYPSFASGGNLIIICSEDTGVINISDSTGIIMTYNKLGIGCDTLSIPYIPSQSFNLEKAYIKLSSNFNMLVYCSIENNCDARLMRILPPVTLAGHENCILGYNYLTVSGTIFFSDINITTLGDSTEVDLIFNQPHPLISSGISYSVQIPEYTTYTDRSTNYDYTGSLVKVNSNSNAKFQILTGFPMLFSANPWQRFPGTLTYPLPIEFLGQSYHTIPHLTRLGDEFRAIAFEDSTEISINGINKVINTLEVFDTIISTPSIWQGNKSFSLIQFSRHSFTDSVFNSSAFAYPIIPDGNLITKSIFMTDPLADPFCLPFESYINLLCSCNDTLNNTLNGTNIIGYQVFPYDTSMCYIQQAITNGTHSILSDSGFIGYFYSYGPGIGTGSVIGGLVMKNTIIGFNEIEAKIDISIYPNPTMGHFSIVFNEYFNGNISIQNYLGQSIKELSIDNGTSLDFNLTNFTPGIYFIQIQDSNGDIVLTKRIIKL